MASDLRSHVWHFRKKIAFAVLVICTVYAVYLLSQNCCTRSVHSRNNNSNNHESSSTRKLSSNGNKKSGNISGNSLSNHGHKYTPQIKGKLISRTLVGLTDRNLSSDSHGHGYRTKDGKLVSEASSSWSSSDSEEAKSLEYLSSSDGEDDGKVEDENVLDKPALDPGYVQPLQKNQQTNLTKKFPNALIIGVKKGGTRALLEFIRLHPDVKAAGAEVHFFNKYYDKGLEWYRQQMPPTLEGQLTIEKTPGYFPNPDVPEKVYNMNKDVKLIIVFRDPVSRIISDYAQSLTKGKKPPFEEVVMKDYTGGVLDLNWSPIRISLYADHLRKWLSYFPLNQFVFLSGENLVRNPAQELIKLQKFLDLDVVIDENYFYFNQTKGFPCLKKGQDPKCLGESKGRKHPDVDPYVIKRLQYFLKPYNERLYQMTGINFNWENSIHAKL